MSRATELATALLDEYEHQWNSLDPWVQAFRVLAGRDTLEARRRAGRRAAKPGENGT